jgi:tRNA G10  N-methylase Trm11
MKRNGMIVDAEKAVDIFLIMKELGGTIAAGKVLFSGSAEEVFKKISSEAIYAGREIKMTYSLINFADAGIERRVLEAMKENFKKEGLKARFKGVGGTIKMQGGSIASGSPSKIMLRDMNYFVFDGNSGISFGILESCADAKESEKRDIGKPERREELAISPRLAKILINLSGAKKGGIVLDPFCGIGVILQEALLMGINAVGVEIDASAAKNAKKNIEWLKKNYSVSAECEVINADSRKARLRKNIDGIATEPALGKLLKRVPSREEAQEMAKGFESLIAKVLENVKKYLKKGGKIAFTSPLIKTNAEKVGCDIGRIASSAGLKVYEIAGLKEAAFPIREFREGQIVGREIWVLTA